MIHLYAVAFLTGTLSVFFFVSYSTLFVSIVPRERYIEGNSILNGSRALSFVGGPGLAGFLVESLSAAYALVADAASFVVSAMFLSRISPSEPPPQESGRGHVVEGARFILQSPIVRASLAATATINFFNFVFHALFVLYVTRSLEVQPGMLGAVLGAGLLGRSSDPPSPDGWHGVSGLGLPSRSAACSFHCHWCWCLLLRGQDCSFCRYCSLLGSDQAWAS